MLTSLSRRAPRLAGVALALAAVTAPALAGDTAPLFRRVASFPVFLNTDVDEQTSAEIVAASEDGMRLVYTDAATGNLGFIDITDPSDPQPGGVLDVGGEPTSVATTRGYALVGVNTSEDFVDTSGVLQVVDLDARAIVRTIDLGGQPDSIAISPDERFAAVVIENERDEDLGNGEPPQLPAGFLVIVDILGDPAGWTTQDVALTGIADLFPEDPEPEYVDINAANLAVVTLQENNHIALVDLETAQVVGDFPAGTVDLAGIDTDDDGLVDQTDALADLAREPDAVAWLSDAAFATADEGDLFGGSRGFTTFDTAGNVLFSSGNALDRRAARMGHYPEGRSDNKGVEPEAVEVGVYGGDAPFVPATQYLFVGSERANVVFVYEVPAGDPIVGASNPRLMQVLPTGIGPEGLLAIPQRNLLVVACEEDSREDKFRAVVGIYELGTVNYPTVVSGDRADGSPIPWAGLSALASEASTAGDVVYAAYDSVFRQSRIFTLDASATPARITDELVIRDDLGILFTALANLLAALPDPGDFDPADLVDADGTVNLDVEGLAIGPDGDFWIASEGAGNLEDGISDPDSQPFTSPNLLAKVDRNGTIVGVVLPPLELLLDQFRFGFEGVAVSDEGADGSEVVYVAFQRAWQDAGDPAKRARIGRYDVAAGTWTYAYYPLFAPQSPNGGWVGLSEITALGNGLFAVIERDDQGGPDARIKALAVFSTAGVSFADESRAGAFDVVSKLFVLDVLGAGLYAGTGGLVPEKLEGLTLLPSGGALLVNDNDGVEDNNGETQLVRIE